MRTAPGRVLYFAAEESPTEWEMALRPWLGEPDPKAFRVAHGGFALDHVPDLHALSAKVFGDSIRLVIVDPLIAATASLNTVLNQRPATPEEARAASSPWT